MLFKRILPLLFLTVAINVVFAQSEEDSVRSLSEVTVRAFEQNTRQNLTTAVVKVVDVPVPFNNKVSFVQAFNTVAGVRMEERSPGSYRINIRGSSLRSPFGVRNVKVYWNDIPFTDPGGNTYFNQFAYNNSSYIQIFKGPASSMYGPGTGGLVIVGNELKHHKTGVEYLTGSNNYHTVMAKALWGNDSTGTSMVTYARSQGDGYREQTKMRRDNISWVTEMNINKKHSLNAAVLYTDMYYQTPGGLTLKEFQENPRASRPAVGRFPAAKAINASIWQKTFTAGVTHNNAINQHFNHKTTLYGAYAQVKNSAVRNFERRSEPHFGARTILTYNKNFGADNSNVFKWDNGIEFQQGYFNTQVANNKNGVPDTLQTNDDINATVYSFLTQANFNLGSKWIFTAGASFNKNKLRFARLSEYPVNEQVFNYDNEFAPRLAVMHRFTDDLSLVGAVSKGFSPPTIAELLPSTGVITPLNAEHGWNYELTFRKNIRAINADFEINSYLFKLNDALVQRRDEAGADYFVNAGKIDQKGIETYAGQTILPRNRSVIDYFTYRLGYTYSHFRYGSFVKEGNDYSGKIIPGVPEHSVSYVGDITFKPGVYANVNYYAASKIFMNDANTEATEPYFLLGFRVGWKKALSRKINANIYTGVDNALNQLYSLGNDINAAAGRYYNVAPGRNYYAGIAFELNRNNTGTR